MNMQKMGTMLKTLTELQKKTDAIQTELANSVYEGQAAQGLVKVTLSGKGEMVRIFISPEVLSEDNQTVEDIINVAHKDAFDKKEADAKKKLASIAGGLMPMGFKLPGFG